MRQRTGEWTGWLPGTEPLDRVADAVPEVLTDAVPGAVAAAVAEGDAPTDRVSVGLAGAVLALVASTVALRVANNLPGPMGPDLALAHAWLATAGPSAVAILCVLVGVTRREAHPRVGLVLAGVFGLLGLHVPAASLPAVVAVAAGTGLAVTGGVRDAGWTRPAAVAAVVWVGLALALASATGLLSGVRPTASTVALVGVALLPLVVEPPRWAWAAGLAAAAGVLWVGSVLPFVTGAVVLVGFAVVGAPLVAVAGATGGGVAGLAGAVAGSTRANTGRWAAVVAVGLLLAAGVPATIPRALAAGVGLALLVGGEAS